MAFKRKFDFLHKESTERNERMYSLFSMNETQLLDYVLPIECKEQEMRSLVPKQSEQRRDQWKERERKEEREMFAFKCLECCECKYECMLYVWVRSLLLKKEWLLMSHFGGTGVQSNGKEVLGIRSKGKRLLHGNRKNGPSEALHWIIESRLPAKKRPKRRRGRRGRHTMDPITHSRVSQGNNG